MSTCNPVSQKKRYHLIDGIRGFAVINMIAFHFLYDIHIIFEKNPSWYSLPLVELWQEGISCTFILISGFVMKWSKEGNLRRGLRLNLYGLLITVVTLIATPSVAVWFGILNFLGCALWLLTLLRKPMEKISPLPGLGICLLLFVLCKNIQFGYLGIGNFLKIPVPDILYSIKILTPFGFQFPEFYSSDYFPVLPWIFLYLGGFFLSRILMKYDLWQKIACRKIPFLSAIGRKSIWIYLIHQPVIMLICILLMFFMKYLGA